VALPVLGADIRRRPASIAQQNLTDRTLSERAESVLLHWEAELFHEHAGAGLFKDDEKR
jgi:hypothetical protein